VIFFPFDQKLTYLKFFIPNDFFVSPFEIFQLKVFFIELVSFLQLFSLQSFNLSLINCDFFFLCP